MRQDPASMSMHTIWNPKTRGREAKSMLEAELPSLHAIVTGLEPSGNKHGSAFCNAASLTGID